MKKKSKNAYFLIMIAATLSSLGQLAWKFATTPSFHAAIVLLLMIVGFISAGLGLLFETVAFRYGQVSILQPMMSFSFVLSILWGTLFLSEPITLKKITAILLIVLGCILIGSDEEEQS